MAERRIQTDGWSSAGHPQGNRFIVDVAAWTQERSIDESRLLGLVDPIARVNVAKEVQSGPDAIDGFEQLRVALVNVGAGTGIENAVWWAVADQDVRAIRNLCVKASALFRRPYAERGTNAGYGEFPISANPLSRHLG
ncbi:hypothetical protein H7849_23800 [Alloacidobacterium dinghuense]|uniref:Uncharacterized protein n=1 Tax=Alloacidobacterium dinghuense TaxID=2763107 RepID=A0A7G8BHI0_9BACT|nr:hypothetical protein [Alloacidobacterium dinghuense]QNI32000.1 hypothetical protein H7849_23800 [Alloacidobacterium dinghuense]